MRQGFYRGASLFLRADASGIPARRSPFRPMRADRGARTGALLFSARDSTASEERAICRPVTPAPASDIQASFFIASAKCRRASVFIF